MAKPIRLDDRQPNELFDLSISPTVKLIRDFRDLIEAYDPLLSTNRAVIKVMEQAVKDFWLPGYERKVLDKKVKKGYKEGSDIIKEVG